MVETIQYYNVRFYLMLKDEREHRWFSFLERRIMAGERMVMKDIYGWCVSHGVQYRTRFCYRPDFPVMANLWNLYSYLRGKIDMGRAGKEAADV